MRFPAVSGTSSQSVTSIQGFTGVDPDAIVAFIPVISACAVSAVDAAALWNTNEGNNDLQLVSPQSQTIYLNMTLLYTDE